MRDDLASNLNGGIAVLHYIPQRLMQSRLTHRCVLSLVFLQASAGAIAAMPLNQYQEQIQKAFSALDTLAQSDEGESEESRVSRIAGTLSAVRTVVPESQMVEWDGTNFKVDNSWLHREIEKLEKEPEEQRARSLKFVTERLQALAQQLVEVADLSSTGRTKAEASEKLAEILRRPEYARNAQQGSALARLLRKFWNWLQNLLPKPKPLQPGSAGLFTWIAQIFVILLALAVIAYAVKLFAPRVFRKGGRKKKEKRAPRIVLGETLEPDQSAADLLADAEALARRGELRAAIRKAYIALLVELGERKIISLAQHKTNRDYLTAVREKEPLYTHVKQLTDRFEQHWYGFVAATEADWLEFRAGFKTVTGNR